MEQKTRTVQRYVDILTEAGFKAVFGVEKNKDVLIDLLNVVLPEHRRVQDLTYSTTELPGFTMANKSVRLDLRCTGEDGAKFIVEMQCYRQVNFFKRCVLYAAKSYDSGSLSGDLQKYDLPPVYFIGLLSGDMQRFQNAPDNESGEGPVLEYTFREKITHKVPDETIMIIFVELNRFRKRLDECTTLFDKWCYSLKHVGTLDSLPEDLRLKAFERFFSACEIARLSPEVKLTYEKDMITEQDYYNIIETAREEGLALGRSEGRKEGREEGLKAGRREAIIDLAEKMKRQGLDMDIICETTGLTKEEIALL